MSTTLYTALEHIKQGKLIIVCDSTDRENEGDFFLAAEHCTPSLLAFMIRYSTGIVCTPILKELAVKLGLQVMSKRNRDPNGTNFTVSIDASSTFTGVSAEERTQTILELLKDAPNIRSPGHVFPLVASDGLLHARQGHTEAAVVLCQLAKCAPVGVIAECVNEDGSMMRYDDCISFGQTHNIPVITVDELKEYWCTFFPSPSQPSLSHIKQTTTKIPLLVDNEPTWFTMTVYVHALTGQEVICVTNGEYHNIRVHSECVTGHIFRSLKCDCDQQLHTMLRLIKREGGAVFYVCGHEGRGIGLFHKIRAYHMQQEYGLDTFQANREIGCDVECREYSFVKEIFQLLNLSHFTLHTNNPEKCSHFSSFHCTLTPLPVEVNEYNRPYLVAKQRLAGHTMNVADRKSYHICVISTNWNRSYIEEAWIRFRAYSGASIVFSEIIVPGAYEIPATVSRVIASSHGDVMKIDAIICLGVLIKGESKHFEYISKAVFDGLMNVTLVSPIPIINGILTVLNKDQIMPRMEEGSVEWLEGAIQMCNVYGNTLPINV